MLYELRFTNESWGIPFTERVIVTAPAPRAGLAPTSVRKYAHDWAHDAAHRLGAEFDTDINFTISVEVQLLTPPAIKPDGSTAEPERRKTVWADVWTIYSKDHMQKITDSITKHPSNQTKEP